MKKTITVLMLTTLFFSPHLQTAVINFPELSFSFTHQDEALYNRALRRTAFTVVGGFLACSGVVSLRDASLKKKDDAVENFSALAKRYSFGTAQLLGGMLLIYYTTQST